MAGKMMIKACKKKDPAHPCDPEPPCDICDESDDCPKPNLCMEKIKNPQKPYETRCKPGEFLPASVCMKPEPPHPCDPPPPCEPGKPKKQPCPYPTLCKEKIKNPVDPIIMCPHPDDIYSEELCENLDLLKTPLPECTRDPCAPPLLKDPFKEVEKMEYLPEVKDPNEYLYSRELCKHLGMLKQKIKSCFDPCTPKMTDPFEEIDEESKYPEKEDPCDVDPRVLKKEMKKRMKKIEES